MLDINRNGVEDYFKILLPRKYLISIRNNRKNGEVAKREDILNAYRNIMSGSYLWKPFMTTNKIISDYFLRILKFDIFSRNIR